MNWHHLLSLPSSVLADEGPFVSSGSGQKKKKKKKTDFTFL
jgi:hypothetical protein